MIIIIFIIKIIITIVYTYNGDVIKNGPKAELGIKKVNLPDSLHLETCP